MTTTTYGFNVEASPTNPGMNGPQKLGRNLWKPMWLMAIIAFVAAIIAAGARAQAIAGGAPELSAAARGHVVTGLMFIGFATVFASIAFAVARILGEFRDGGGRVQEALGVEVVGLKMPGAARAFIIMMMMAMMVILVAVGYHFSVAAGLSSGRVSIPEAETAAIVLEGVRRTGVALYLVSITLGLATIGKVLRFQALRIADLPRVSGRQA